MLCATNPMGTLVSMDSLNSSGGGWSSSPLAYGSLILIAWYISNAYCAIYTKEVVSTTNSSNWTAVMDATLAEFLMGVICSGFIILYRNEDLFPFTQSDLLNSQNLISGLCHMFGSLFLCFSYNLMGAAITQILKATDPIFTVILSYLIDQKLSSTHTLISLSYIVIGIMSCTSTNGDFSLSFVGVVVTMLSNLFMSLRTILCKKLSNMKSCSAYQSYLLTSTIAGLAFLPLYLSYYLSFVFQYYLSSPPDSPLSPSSSSLSSPLPLDQYISLLFLAALFHASYNICAFAFLELVTPITYSVANLCKRIVSILMAMVFFHQPITLKTLMSLIVLSVGVAIYIGTTIEITSTIYYQHAFCVLLIVSLSFI
jgi:drug/metabolite transporter (DMT)-like permease